MHFSSFFACFYTLREECLLFSVVMDSMPQRMLLLVYITLLKLKISGWESASENKNESVSILDTDYGVRSEHSLLWFSLHVKKCARKQKTRIVSLVSMVVTCVYCKWFLSHSSCSFPACCFQTVKLPFQTFFSEMCYLLSAYMWLTVCLMSQRKTLSLNIYTHIRVYILFWFKSNFKL